MLNALKLGLKRYALMHNRSIVYHDGADTTAELVRRMWPITTTCTLDRFGGDTDGAYLMPDDLEGIEAVFSPGVSTVATFEEQMAERGIDCYLADASVTAPPVMNDRFHFIPKFLGLYNSDKYMTIDRWVDENTPGGGDLLLQMDIEGAEWSVLANVSERLLHRFRIMVVEFHGLERLLHSRPEREVLERLLMTHHVVHVHANNAGPVPRAGSLELPEYLEVTFWRKDRAEPAGYATKFPHPLDIVNVASLPPLTLPDCWHA